jgi:hypothetical protein
MQRVESSNGLSHAYQVNRIFCLSNFSLDRCLLRRPEVCLSGLSIILPSPFDVARDAAKSLRNRWWNALFWVQFDCCAPIDDRLIVTIGLFAW